MTGAITTYAEHLLSLTSPVVEEQGKASPVAVSHRSCAGHKTYAGVVLAMALSVSSGQPLHASTDGAIAQGGAGSTARIGLSLVIPERIEVQGLSPVALSQTPAGDLTVAGIGCVTGRGAPGHSVSARLAGQPLSATEFSIALPDCDAADSAGLQVRLAKDPSSGPLTLVFAPE